MIYQMQQTRGAALAPLSSEQRQKLAAIASYAWKEIGPDQSFNDWRHEQCQKIVGKPGLTHCSNEDYLPLKAHWLEICGHVAASLRASLKSANEPRSWAFFNLMKACTDAKDVMPEAMKYARGFVMNKRGIALDDADDRTIWHAVFTVRRKAQSLRKKKSGGGEPAGDVLSRLLGKGKPTTKAVRHVKGPF